MAQQQRLETWGNERTMNMESILAMNIQSSAYFKGLLRFKSWNEVIDEIRSEVKTVEPWLSAGSRTPSTAFCLLYKLFTLKITEKQMTAMLNYKNAPFVRALGFLFLRYAYPPKWLWDWFEGYLEDDEEVSLRGPRGNPVQIGKFVRDLLLQQKYFDTILPRIPVPIMKEIQQKLQEHDKEYEQYNNDNNKVDEDNQNSRRSSSPRQRSRSLSRDRKPRSSSRSRSPIKRSRSRDRRSRSTERRGSKDRYRSTDRYRDRRGHRSRSRSRSRDRRRRSRSRSRSPRYRRSRSPRDRRSRSPRDRRRSKSPRERRKRSRSPSPTTWKKKSRSPSPATNTNTNTSSGTVPKTSMDTLKALYGARTASTTLPTVHKTASHPNTWGTDTITIGLPKKKKM